MLLEKEKSHQERMTQLNKIVKAGESPWNDF